MSSCLSCCFPPLVLVLVFVWFLEGDTSRTEVQGDVQSGRMAEDMRARRHLFAGLVGGESAGKRGKGGGKARAGARRAERGWITEVVRSVQRALPGRERRGKL